MGFLRLGLLLKSQPKSKVGKAEMGILTHQPTPWTQARPMMAAVAISSSNKASETLPDTP
jgi:hypothetical protein